MTQIVTEENNILSTESPLDQNSIPYVSDILSYLFPDETKKNSWTSNLKSIYNHLVAVSSHDPNVKQKILLPKLLIQNFDNEQIWQQIELLNTVLVDNLEIEISKKIEFGHHEPEVKTRNDIDGMTSGYSDNENESDIINESDDNEIHTDNKTDEEGEVDKNEQEIPKFDKETIDKMCEEMEKEQSSDSEADDGLLPSIFAGDEEELDESKFIDKSDALFESDSGEVETKLSKHLKKVQAKIATHEEKALQEKPWFMMGESSQKDRETNALLEEDLQFDHGTRPAPEITLDVTNKFEKLIIERIKSRLFDDVERKEKPVGRDKMKHELPLNQEKSQLSLAEVYEKDYLEAQEKSTGEEKEKVDENEEAIKTDLDKLFRKLDALSNFNYTPKGVKDELKIVVNAPAITIEEAMPTSVAETQILAPAEVKSKQKEELRTEGEETKTDKKRKRRKIKKSQSAKSQERVLKKLKTERTIGSKKIKTKSDAIAAVEENVKEGITLAKKSSGKVSSNFFSRLQDSINEEGNKKLTKKKKTSNSNKFNKF